MATMEGYKLFSFVRILRESIRVLQKNWKLMASITTITSFIYSVLFYGNILSTKPFIRDLVIKETYFFGTKPRSAALLTGMIQDLRILLLSESSFVIAYSVISLIFSTAIILVASVTYTGKNVSVKDLLSRVARTFLRRVVTWFYLSLLQIGYALFVLALLINLVLIIGSRNASIAIAVALSIPALVCYIYLSVVWQLAVMVTVIEESCGIEALGKAGVLVKGSRLHGFVLSSLFMVPSVIMFRGFRIITARQWVATSINVTMALFMISAIFVVKLLELIAYTVFYFQCKKMHGEEIELQGSWEYTKVPTKPLAEDIP